MPYLLNLGKKRSYTKGAQQVRVMAPIEWARINKAGNLVPVLIRDEPGIPPVKWTEIYAEYFQSTMEMHQILLEHEFTKNTQMKFISIPTLYSIPPEMYGYSSTGAQTANSDLYSVALFHNISPDLKDLQDFLVSKDDAWIKKQICRMFGFNPDGSTSETGSGYSSLVTDTPFALWLWTDIVRPCYTSDNDNLAFDRIRPRLKEALK